MCQFHKNWNFCSCARCFFETLRVLSLHYRTDPVYQSLRNSIVRVRLSVLGVGLQNQFRFANLKQKDTQETKLPSCCENSTEMNYARKNCFSELNYARKKFFKPFL